jgi:hypothetical protein
MSRAKRRFPVSRPQGMENRGTAANTLADGDLLFPQPISQNARPGRRSAARIAGTDAKGPKRPQPASLVSPMKVERLYQPQSLCATNLEDILQELLVSDQESHKSSPLAEPESTCFPRQHE